MIDFEMLKKAIKASGKTTTQVVIDAKMSRETFYNRMKGVGEFTASEIINISDAIGLKPEEREAIFFAKEVV